MYERYYYEGVPGLRHCLLSPPPPSPSSTISSFLSHPTLLPQAPLSADWALCAAPHSQRWGGLDRNGGRFDRTVVEWLVVLRRTWLEHGPLRFSPSFSRRPSVFMSEKSRKAALYHGSCLMTSGSILHNRNWCVC